MHLLIVFLIFGCFACGDSASINIDLGEDGTKISELSQAELDQICEQFDEILRDDIAKSIYLESACLFSATYDMADDNWDEAACQTAYYACISEGVPRGRSGPGGRKLEGCKEQMKTEALITCDATVGAYEACLMKSHDRSLEQMEWMAKASCNYASNLALGEPDPAMFGAITECVDLEVLTEGFEEPSCSRLELPWGGAH